MAQGCPQRVADPALPSICLSGFPVPISGISLSLPQIPPLPPIQQNKTSLYLEEEGVIFTWLGRWGVVKGSEKIQLALTKLLLVFFLEFFWGAGRVLEFHVLLALSTQQRPRMPTCWAAAGLPRLTLSGGSSFAHVDDVCGWDPTLKGPLLTGQARLTESNGERLI